MGLVLAPVFVVVAAFGLWALSSHSTAQADNALSTRLGNAAARVALAMERHAKTDDTPEAWAAPLPMELLKTLLSDQAIRCVTFKRDDAAKTTLIAPYPIGCIGQDIDATFSIPLSTGARSTLEIGYDKAEIESLKSIWLGLSAIILACGVLLSIATAWLGFRLFINTPLRRLLESIECSETSGVPTTVEVRQNDELGSVMAAFNTMQMRDKEKTHLLELERARFACVLDSMMDGLIVVGADTRVIMTNLASCKLLGKSSDEITGASVLNLFRSVRSDSKELADLSCVEALVADGSIVPVLTSVASMLNGENTTVYVFRDISDVIERERKLQKTILEALSANRAKTEFLANMSHELRTPLNAIIGFSEIISSGMLGGPRNAAAEEYAGDINDSGQHLLALINDILDIAKVETGETKVYPEFVGVREVFGSVKRVMRTHALQGEVMLDIATPDDSFALYIDTLRLKQILINLVSNAVKFTDPGGTVSVDARHEDEGIAIVVRDTGIGMTEFEIGEAMKPFRQVDNSHTRKYEGTGLGLPLSKSLVELMGGIFEIRSRKGRGTEVRVRFPDAQTMAADAGISL